MTLLGHVLTCDPGRAPPAFRRRWGSRGQRVVLAPGGIREQPVPFTVDRPFIFFIRDATGLLLFAGQVVDPTA